MNKQDNFSSPGYQQANRNAGVYTVRSRPVSGPARASRAVPRNAFTLDPLLLFPQSSVITVLGRVEDWSLEWAGQIRCTLCLSIGDVPIAANRDSLPQEVRNGAWVRAKLLQRRGSAMRLLGVKVVTPEPGMTTAWTPTLVFHRTAHMRRLRRLLSQFKPGLQAIFMAVMVNERVQHGFLLRIAATDHHSYPGGLFDHSIEAAEQVYRQEGFSEHERGLAALTCLLFDLGKVLDVQIRPDRSRRYTGLEPHALTLCCIWRALDSVARFEPELVASLQMLLAAGDWTEWVAPPGIVPTLKQCVHQALQQSWQLDQAGKDLDTNKGAKK